MNNLFFEEIYETEIHSDFRFYFSFISIGVSFGDLRDDPARPEDQTSPYETEGQEIKQVESSQSRPVSETGNPCLPMWAYDCITLTRGNSFTGDLVERASCKFSLKNIFFNFDIEEDSSSLEEDPSILIIDLKFS